MDDMYLGIGPQFGASFLPQSYEIVGTTGTAVTNVYDIGGNPVFGFVDDMYFIVGLGSAEVSVTATVGGQSETVEMPESASYKRISCGWENGYSVGISYVSYSDWAKNLSRFEINLGYAF